MIPQNTGEFQYISCFYRCFWKYISIHLMFLLIMQDVWAHRCRNGISIHLMFLLIRTAKGTLDRRKNFNTSHVSINLLRQHKRENLFYISIHLMFLLISKRGTPVRHLHYFNTSHVSINRRSLIRPVSHISDFNTSHVSINRFPVLGPVGNDLHFNTSHVSINHGR